MISRHRAGTSASQVPLVGDYGWAAIAWLVGFVLWQLAGGAGGRSATVISDIAPLPIEIGAVVLALLAARASTGRQRKGWQFLAAAFGLYLAGDVLWLWFEVGMDQTPFPSLADVAYLAFYPVLLIGLLCLRGGRDTSGDRVRFGFDVAIVVICGAMAVWYVVISPLVHEANDFGAGTWLSLAYPIMDLVLVFGVCAALFRKTAPNAGALRLLLAGVLAFVLADIAFACLNLLDSYSSGTWPDTLWMVAITAMLLAADYQRRCGASIDVVDPDDEIASATMVSLLPYVAIAGAYTLLLVVGFSSSQFSFDGLLVGAVLLTAVVVARQVTVLRDNARLIGELQRLATVDSLTGVCSRRRVLDRAVVLYAEAMRDDLPLAVVMVDVDHFKRINDSYGHAVGDDALHFVGQMCERTMPAGCVVGRYGGDEFVLLLPGATLSEALELAEDLAATVAKVEQPIADGPAELTLSLGVASAMGSRDLAAVLRDADAALYEAKRSGRSRARAHPYAAASVSRAEATIGPTAG